MARGGRLLLLAVVASLAAEAACISAAVVSSVQIDMRDSAAAKLSRAPRHSMAFLSAPARPTTFSAQPVAVDWLNPTVGEAVGLSMASMFLLVSGKDAVAMQRQRDLELAKNPKVTFSTQPLDFNLTSGALFKGRFTMDLGEPKVVGALLVSNVESPDRSNLKGTKDFVIQTSVDGLNWTVAHRSWLCPGRVKGRSEVLQALLCKEDEGRASQFVYFSARPARYIRFRSLTWYQGGDGLISCKVYAQRGTRWLLAMTRPVDALQSFIDSLHPDEFTGSLDLPDQVGGQVEDAPVPIQSPGLLSRLVGYDPTIQQYQAGGMEGAFPKSRKFKMIKFLKKSARMAGEGVSTAIKDPKQMARSSAQCFQWVAANASTAVAVNTNKFATGFSSRVRPFLRWLAEKKDAAAGSIADMIKNFFVSLNTADGVLRIGAILISVHFASSLFRKGYPILVETLPPEDEPSLRSRERERERQFRADQKKAEIALKKKRQADEQSRRDEEKRVRLLEKRKIDREREAERTKKAARRADELEYKEFERSRPETYTKAVERQQKQAERAARQEERRLILIQTQKERMEREEQRLQSISEKLAKRRILDDKFDEKEAYNVFQKISQRQEWMLKRYRNLAKEIKERKNRALEKLSEAKEAQKQASDAARAELAKMQEKELAKATRQAERKRKFEEDSKKREEAKLNQEQVAAERRAARDARVKEEVKAAEEKDRAMQLKKDEETLVRRAKFEQDAALRPQAIKERKERHETERKSKMEFSWWKMRADELESQERAYARKQKFGEDAAKRADVLKERKARHEEEKKRKVEETARKAQADEEAAAARAAEQKRKFEEDAAKRPDAKKEREARRAEELKNKVETTALKALEDMAAASQRALSHRLKFEEDAALRPILKKEQVQRRAEEQKRKREEVARKAQEEAEAAAERERLNKLKFGEESARRPDAKKEREAKRAEEQKRKIEEAARKAKADQEAAAVRAAEHKRKFDEDAAKREFVKKEREMKRAEEQRQKVEAAAAKAQAQAQAAAEKERLARVKLQEDAAKREQDKRDREAKRAEEQKKKAQEVARKASEAEAKEQEKARAEQEKLRQRIERAKESDKVKKEAEAKELERARAEKEAADAKAKEEQARKKEAEAKEKERAKAEKEAADAKAREEQVRKKEAEAKELERARAEKEAADAKAREEQARKKEAEAKDRERAKAEKERQRGDKEDERERIRLQKAMEREEREREWERARQARLAARLKADGEHRTFVEEEAQKFLSSLKA